MHIFRMRLGGEQDDLEDLMNLLQNSEWTISKDQDGYYLNCPTTGKDMDPKSAGSVIKEFLNLLNGALKLTFNDSKKITAVHLEKVNQDGSRILYLEFEEDIKIRSRMRASITNGDQQMQPSNLEIWLSKAEKYQSVRDVLRFFNDISWWNLYKVYEIISEDIKPRKRIYDIVPKNEIKLFTQTANSRSALGDAARHATESTAPPKRSLSLVEAQALIARLFNGWMCLKD